MLKMYSSPHKTEYIYVNEVPYIMIIPNTLLRVDYVHE